jgi:pSer/pThr/pTyr-binding forkhead associated (FHA) protein
MQCDALLTEGTNEGETRNLDDVADGVNFPRWGTARLGDERILLLYVRGYDQPLVVPLAEEIILGRYDTTTGETPDVDLNDYGAEEEGVSRRHAAIIAEEDALKVIDLGSANATFINGQKLIAHQARILRDGDELRLGHLVIRVHFA